MRFDDDLGHCGCTAATIFSWGFARATDIDGQPSESFSSASDVRLYVRTTCHSEPLSPNLDDHNGEKTREREGRFTLERYIDSGAWVVSLLLPADVATPPPIFSSVELNGVSNGNWVDRMNDAKRIDSTQRAMGAERLPHFTVRALNLPRVGWTRDSRQAGWPAARSPSRLIACSLSHCGRSGRLRPAAAWPWPR